MVVVISEIDELLEKINFKKETTHTIIFVGVNNKNKVTLLKLNPSTATQRC